MNEDLRVVELYILSTGVKKVRFGEDMEGMMMRKRRIGAVRYLGERASQLCGERQLAMSVTEVGLVLGPEKFFEVVLG